MLISEVERIRKDIETFPQEELVKMLDSEMVHVEFFTDINLEFLGALVYLKSDGPTLGDGKPTLCVNTRLGKVTVTQDGMTESVNYMRGEFDELLEGLWMTCKEET